MTALLSELGKKIADRWLSALLLPGLLYTVTAVCAWLAGHRHALDPRHLAAAVDRLVHHLGPKPVAVALAIMAALLTATAAALAAEGLAGVLHRGFIAHGPRRWVAHRAAHATASLPRYLPRRATPVGDRFYLLGERVEAQYGLDITLVWPRLWLLLPEPVRVTVQTTYARYHAAAVTCGWGLLYLALVLIWWPALLAGAVTIAVGYRRAVATSAVLADVMEAVTDVHQQALANAMGIALRHGRLTRAEGLQINNILNKRA